MKAEFRSLYVCQEEKTKKLEIEVTSLNKQLLKLEEKIDENDSHERRETLVLSCTTIPLESNMENCHGMRIGERCHESKYISL